MGGLICGGADESQDSTPDPSPEKNEAEILVNLSEEKPLVLKGGYELAVKSADIDGNKVYSELYRDGKMVDSRVIIPANEVDDTFVYPRPETVEGHKIAVHLKNALRGAEQDIVTVDQVYQTSEIYPHSIKLNDSALRTIASGRPLVLEEGYDLILHSADIDGNKACLDLRKEGEIIDSQLILPANDVCDTFVYSRPGTSHEIRVHFKNAFRGADYNLITIDRVWQNSEGDPDLALIDHSQSLTVTSGTPLILEEGYELTIQSIDIDGNKVYMELAKDGEVVDSQVIIPANEIDDTFEYFKSGTSQEIKVHFKNAFRGADQNLATIDGLWQTSEVNPGQILIDDSRSRTVTSGTPLALEEGYELAIQSVDIDGNKVYTELYKDGEVVDSQVIIAANEVESAFIYSMPGTSQAIRIHFKNAFRGADQNLVTIDRIWQNSEENPDLVLIDHSQSLTVTSGTPLKLEEGYDLMIQSVDIDGNKVYLELAKDGEVVDSQVILPANEIDDTFEYIKPETSQEIRIHFKNAFRGRDQNLVTIDEIWQNSESNPDLILVDSSQSLTMTSGTPLKLEEGYELAIQSVDIDGNRTYVELLDDGEVTASKVVVPANEVADTFVYTEPGMQRELTVHFKNSFRDAKGGFATIDYISQ